MSPMISPLAHGCPPQAIVVTFAVDERTVAAWQRGNVLPVITARRSIKLWSSGGSWTWGKSRPTNSG